MTEGPGLTANQMKAVRRLEDALRQCKRERISIRGQGDTLNAWAGQFYCDVEPALDPDFCAMVTTWSVKHYGCYVDSGADDQLYGYLTVAGRSALRDGGEK